MSQHTTAAFVPAYLPSNMSDAEFVRAMGECLPREIVERMEGLRDNTPAEVIKAASKAFEIMGDAIKDLEKITEGIQESVSFEGATMEEVRQVFADRGKLVDKLQGVIARIDKAQEAISEIQE